MKNIIFDFDGTLLDSFPLLVSSLDLAADEFKLLHLKDIDIEKLRDMSFSKLIKELRVPIWTLPFLIRWVRREMHSKIHTLDLIPGVKEMLLALSKDHNLFVLTSNSKENVELVMKDNELDHLFKEVVGGVGLLSKNRALKRFFRKHNIKKENSIYVSDETRDIETTKKIGLECVGVTWGYQTENALRGSGAKHIIHKPSELVEFLVASS